MTPEEEAYEEALRRQAEAYEETLRRIREAEKTGALALDLSGRNRIALGLGTLSINSTSARVGTPYLAPIA